MSPSCGRPQPRQSAIGNRQSAIGNRQDVITVIRGAVDRGISTHVFGLDSRTEQIKGLADAPLRRLRMDTIDLF
jgi:hypothetical protein